MQPPAVHLIQILIRHQHDGQVKFLLHPHASWRLNNSSSPYLVLPTDKTVAEPDTPFRRGESLERYIDDVAMNELGLANEDFALEQELSAAAITMPSIKERVEKRFLIYPVDVWVKPRARAALKDKLNGEWLTPAESIAHPQIAPSAAAVFKAILSREGELAKRYEQDPVTELREENPHRLLVSVPEQPSMYALARKWFVQNKTGVRHLPKPALDRILDTGNRAFNLRVADPYLRYQMQGLGFTWSFFTHKDNQEIHVHGAPVVEIYSVLEGRMEIWWKPYYDRGTSAWSHAILDAGDWIEVDSLQCHVVHWLTEGKGVVFKAGPGPLAEVGKLGIKGKTPCNDCPCIKPPEVSLLASG
jgi:mannose-6-phosphate isomerase-like protein (cupin superfamily)